MILNSMSQAFVNATIKVAEEGRKHKVAEYVATIASRIDMSRRQAGFAYPEDKEKARRLEQRFNDTGSYQASPLRFLRSA